MRYLLVFFILLFFSACAPLQQPALYVPSAGGEYMTASWYGKKFHGRQTASGERYDMYGFTAAHKTMKFGTKLRVTNPDTGNSVVVKVNDRGPFIRGRDLDLSYGAAKAIGLVKKGVGRVRIEHIGRDMRYVKRVPFIQPGASSRPFTIQVASFAEPSRAFRLKEGLDINYRDVYITRVTVGGVKYHRVKVGRFSNYESAHAIAEKLAEEGYTIFITSR